jgi:hypothetical protein
LSPPQELAMMSSVPGPRPLAYKCEFVRVSNWLLQLHCSAIDCVCIQEHLSTGSRRDQ